MVLEELRALAAVRTRGRWLALMYHELDVPGRPRAAGGAGYALYCVAAASFRAHMRALAGAGMRGASIGVSSRAPADGGTVAVTFDDGCETDWAEAAPVLSEHGFGATFFVVAGFLGHRGYMTHAQVRDLAAAGFEIGSHSQTHRSLTGLGACELQDELGGSRARLEDTTGTRVKHLSCPHGRWSPRLAAAAQRAGYETVSTSDVGLNSPRAATLRLRRVAVYRGTSATDVMLLTRGEGLRRRIVRKAAADAVKRLLGDERYALVHDRVSRLMGRAP